MRPSNLYLLLLVAGPAFADDDLHPAKEPLVLTYYSSSVVNDDPNGNRCEYGNGGMASGQSFDRYAVSLDDLPADGPKAVALDPRHNAMRCTLTFLDGPYAGKSALVLDKNGHDTIDVATDTSMYRGSPVGKCKYVLDHGPWSGKPVHFALSKCPGSFVLDLPPGTVSKHKHVDDAEE
jgi:hypothetical protein